MRQSLSDTSHKNATTNCQDKMSLQIVTARKRSCGKVMFLHLPVILFTGGCVCLWIWGVYTPWTLPPPDTPLDTPPSWTHTHHWETPPPELTSPPLRSTSGRYTSYWKNAFLNKQERVPYASVTTRHESQKCDNKLSLQTVSIYF